MKARVFWMDKDILDRALDRCDLGDAQMAKVRQYPHKDMRPDLVRVREIRDYEHVLTGAELERLFREIANGKSDIDAMFEVLKNETESR